MLSNAGEVVAGGTSNRVITLSYSCGTVKSVFRQGRSERECEASRSYPPTLRLPRQALFQWQYVELVSDARTPREEFFTILLTQRHHPIEGHLRPLFLVVRDDDVIHDMAVDEILQRPAEMRGVDAVHRGALTDRR